MEEKGPVPRGSEWIEAGVSADSSKCPVSRMVFEQIGRKETLRMYREQWGYCMVTGNSPTGLEAEVVVRTGVDVKTSNRLGRIVLREDLAEVEACACKWVEIVVCELGGSKQGCKTMGCALASLSDVG